MSVAFHFIICVITYNVFDLIRIDSDSFSLSNIVVMLMHLSMLLFNYLGFFDLFIYAIIKYSRELWDLTSCPIFISYPLSYAMDVSLFERVKVLTLFLNHFSDCLYLF